MREIKFRAWDDNSLMIYSGNLAEFFSYMDPSAPLMQYTGLKDKKGKEIYEGDIVKFYGTKPNDEEEMIALGEDYEGGWHDVERIGEVTFSEATFWVGGTRWFSDKVEVIGNIHENPELL